MTEIKNSNYEIIGNENNTNQDDIYNSNSNISLKEEPFLEETPFPSIVSQTYVPFATSATQTSFKKSERSKYSIRYSIKENLEKAIEILKETIELIKISEEPIEKANNLYEFYNILQKLWKLKNIRENNWGDLINLLQIVLKRENFEEISLEKIKGLFEIVRNHLAMHPVTDRDIEKSLDILNNCGFDPWVGISGNLEE